MKAYLQIEHLAVVESLRAQFLNNLSLQTIDQSLKADLEIEFGNWLNEWAAGAFREGVVAVSAPMGSPPVSNNDYLTM